MKKSILFFTLTAALLSCKKDKTPAFTATDVTGTTVVKGNINKIVVAPNGSGGWGNGVIPASGVNVSVKVNKNSLYPNSTAQGADVYTGTTDNNGNYSINVKTNASGVEAMITFDGFYGTEDTLINGVTKTGLNASYSGIMQNTTLYMGQNTQFDFTFNPNYISSNPNTVNIGSAVVTGSVGISRVKETLTGTLTTLSNVIVSAPAGTTVYMNFSKDPTLLSAKLYTTTTDANGYYTFNAATVAAGTPGFSQNASIWIPDYSASRDTIKLDGSLKAGRQGVYQMQATSENGLFSGTIRNAVNINYFNFIAN